MRGGSSILKTGTSLVLMLGMAWLILCATGAQADSPPTKEQITRTVQRIVKKARGAALYAGSLIDLDGDGSPEVVFTFPTGAHASRAMAMTWQHGKEQVLFDSGCNTPNAQFVKVNGTPAIVLQQSDDQPDYVTGHRTEELYLWNGTTFAHNPAFDCALRQHEGIMKDGTPYLFDTDDHCLPKREPIPQSLE